MAGRVPRVCNYNSQTKAKGKGGVCCVGYSEMLDEETEEWQHSIKSFGQSPINHQSMTVEQVLYFLF